MDFRESYSTPTQEQFALLGQAVCDWSLVEIELEEVIAALSHCDPYLARASFRRFGFDGKLTALGDLCEIHRHQFRCKAVASETLKRLDGLIKELRTLQQFRNRVAHHVWFRSTDEELFCTPLRSRPYVKDREGGANVTNQQLATYVEKVRVAADALEEILDQLPKASLRGWLGPLGHDSRADC